jgi:hypothetical protein
VTAFPKPRPRILGKADSKRSEDALYRQNRLKALARDHHSCRVCGGSRLLQTHHVERRSHFGRKAVLAKHDVSNLLTVCHDDHVLFTGNVLKAVATSTQGTNGPVQITKWDDILQDYVVFRNPA